MNYCILRNVAAHFCTSHQTRSIVLGQLHFISILSKIGIILQSSIMCLFPLNILYSYKGAFFTDTIILQVKCLVEFIYFKNPFYSAI